MLYIYRVICIPPACNCDQQYADGGWQLQTKYVGMDKLVNTDLLTDLIHIFAKEHKSSLAGQERMKCWYEI